MNAETAKAAAPKTRKKAVPPALEASAAAGTLPAIVKERVGQVISDRMQKTIVVKVVRRVPHLKFKKIVKVSNKFYAHDEKNEAKTGDTVKIRETRPLSHLKRWELVSVLKH
jgi:small subunit ribosomal protein S17